MVEAEDAEAGAGDVAVVIEHEAHPFEFVEAEGDAAEGPDELIVVPDEPVAAVAQGGFDIEEGFFNVEILGHDEVGGAEMAGNTTFQ